MLLNQNKALQLINLLDKSIKKPKTSLKYRNKFTLLTSVVLSAQCTDVNVNNVTKNIYKKYYTPKHFVNLGIKKIRNLIKKIISESYNKDLLFEHYFEDKSDQLEDFTEKLKDLLMNLRYYYNNKNKINYDNHSVVFASDMNFWKHILKRTKQVIIIVNNDLIPWLGSPEMWTSAPQISPGPWTSWAQLLEAVTPLESIGVLLYTYYFYFFIVASLILLVAMLGAIVLTLHKGVDVKRQEVFDQNTREFAKTVSKIS